MTVNGFDSMDLMKKMLEEVSKKDASVELNSFSQDPREHTLKVVVNRADGTAMEFYEKGKTK